MFGKFDVVRNGRKLSDMYDVHGDKNKDLFELSDEMDERAKRAVNRTWDTIGGDCLVNDEGVPDESVSIPKSHMLELVMDANHMETYGDDNEACAYVIWMKWQRPTHYKKFVKKAFPFAKYGW
jgi:hypothetical protein